MWGQIKPENIVAITGHDLKGSSVWSYIEPVRAMAMPGAQFLGGWGAPDEPKPEKGPRSSSMEALLEDPAQLEALIDVAYNVSDAWPPVLRLGGRLRPLMRDALAAQLMYYVEREQHHEMQRVNVALREAVIKCNLQGDHTVHDKLKSWSELTKSKFVNDNLHITAPAASPDTVCTLPLHNKYVARCDSPPVEGRCDTLPVDGIHCR
jgi:hypothetical protein